MEVYKDCQTSKTTPLTIISIVVDPNHFAHKHKTWNLKCYSLIVHLLGRSIGYNALLARIHALWKPIGDLQLVDLENNYFWVRFKDEKDCAYALTEGPWTIYGSYLTVQPWSRSFSTSEKHPSSVIVWVRLPGLPYRYYCKALFRRIANLVGKVVRVDYNTKAEEMGKFARLVVMVDLNKPLRSCIGIDDFVQKLEYEGLNQICFGCGVYGHSKEVCGGLTESKDEPVAMELNQRVATNMEMLHKDLEETEVIPHVIKQGNIKHKAITIVEPGFPANDAGNKRAGKGHNGKKVRG
ncbi:hypothetical protein GQ457_03G022950 [Hibiscus cannabinus]